MPTPAVSRSLRCLVGVVVIAIAVALWLPRSSSAQPLPSGTTVIVFFDTSGFVPEPLDAPQDKLVFIGGRSFLIDMPGCAAPQFMFPLQQAVLVDPGGSRTGRVALVVVAGVGATGLEPVPPGTRLTALGSGITCTSGGILYLKFTGTTE